MDQLSTLILGTWEWQYGIIMQRSIQPPDNLILPESQDYILHYEFITPDQVNTFHDNVLVEQQAFEIRNVPGQNMIYLSISDDSGGLELHHLSADTLFFGSGGWDGSDHLFTRVN